LVSAGVAYQRYSIDYVAAEAGKARPENVEGSFRQTLRVARVLAATRRTDTLIGDEPEQSAG
jgi:hypothetical protein